MSDHIDPTEFPDADDFPSGGPYLSKKKVRELARDIYEVLRAADADASISCEEDGRIVLSVPVLGLSADRSPDGGSPGAPRSRVS